MPFRLRINETWRARPPVVVLMGDLMDGEVRVGDRVAVPLRDGGMLERVVIGVLPGWADRTVEAASVADGYQGVGIAFERGDHRADDIALGIASDAESQVRRKHSANMTKLAVIVVVVALGLIVAVDVALGYLLTGLATDKPSANPPAFTVAASKARGAFIDSVTFEPSSFKWKGKLIVVKEAWLEHQTELVHIHVIVPFVWHQYEYRQVGGYNLCFNLQEASYPLDDDLFFVEQGKGSSFGMLGSVVLWEELDDLDKVPAKIFATDNWKLENSQVLSVKRGRK